MLSSIVKDGDQDQPRDFLYELLISVWLYDLGYTIDFDKETDVVATKGDIIVYGECKRIKSINGYEKNDRKACKQSGKIAVESDKTYRFVFIDVWNCISEQVKTFEYNYKNCFFEFIKTTLETVSNEYKDVIDGFAFTYNCCLWLSNVLNILTDDFKRNPGMPDEKYEFVKANVLSK